LVVGQGGEEGVEMFRRLARLHGMRKFTFALVYFTAFLLAAGIRAQSTSGNEIIISAAISLKNAFEEIGKTFIEKHPGTKVVFNFGASGDLARQIEAGAPVDVFASAAQKDMDDLDQKDIIIKGTREDFARNSLVLIIPTKSAIHLTSFNDLRKGGIQKIAIGNPKTVPAGRYAEEVLRHFNLWDVLKDKLIFAENVRQVLDYATRGEVDAGMVYSTDALVRAKDVKVVAEAPDQSHRPVVYPIAVVKGTKKEALARKFIAVVISKEGEKILERYGFRGSGQRQ
jgi:molybdate transport system substrate-binding protein